MFTYAEKKSKVIQQKKYNKYGISSNKGVNLQNQSKNLISKPYGIGNEFKELVQRKQLSQIIQMAPVNIVVNPTCTVRLTDSFIGRLLKMFAGADKPKRADINPESTIIAIKEDNGKSKLVSITTKGKTVNTLIQLNEAIVGNVYEATHIPLVVKRSGGNHVYNDIADTFTKKLVPKLIPANRVEANFIKLQELLFQFKHLRDGMYFIQGSDGKPIEAGGETFANITTVLNGGTTGGALAAQIAVLLETQSNYFDESAKEKLKGQEGFSEWTTLMEGIVTKIRESLTGMYP